MSSSELSSSGLTAAGLPHGTDRGRFTPRPPEELLAAAIAAGRSRRRTRRRRIAGVAIGSAVIGCASALTLSGVVASRGPSGSGVAVSATQRARVVDLTTRRALGVSVPAQLVAASAGTGAATPPVIGAALRGAFGRWQPLLVAGIEAAEARGELGGPANVIDLSGGHDQDLLVSGSEVGVASLQGEVGDSSHQVWSANLLLFGSAGGALVLVGPCGPAAGAPGSSGQVQQSCPGVEVDFAGVLSPGTATVSTFESHRNVGWIGFGSGPS